MTGDPWRALDILRVAHTHLSNDQADQQEHGAQLLSRVLEEMVALVHEGREDEMLDVFAQIDVEALRWLTAHSMRELARLGWDADEVD
jgi:hypothetical protein